jgi:hypothetical protein
MPQSRATFDDELAWSIECLQEAEAAVRRCHYLAGFEERPPEVGQRLKLKAGAIGVQRGQVEEVAEGALG